MLLINVKEETQYLRLPDFLHQLLKAMRIKPSSMSLWKTQKIVNPLLSEQAPKEKLHDVLHAKINGPKAMNDAGFKTGTVFN